MAYIKRLLYVYFKDVLSAMEKEDLIQEVISLNGQVSSLEETLKCLNLEKGKIDEAFDSLRKQISGRGEDSRDHGEANESKSSDQNNSLSQFSSMETALATLLYIKVIIKKK